MTKIEQARRSIETAMARIGCPPGDNADADLYRDLQRSLAILKDMEGQEPVAWMERWIPPPGETHHPKSMTKWNLVEPKYAGQTLEGRIEELRSYVFDGRAQHEVIAVHAHPSPSAPVDIAEVIAAGEELIRCHRGFHEAIAQHTGNPYPWEPMESAVDQWTTATAKHRTA